MAEFICRLGTPTGDIVTRIVEAEAESAARARLESDGFRVFEIRSAEGGILSGFSLRSGKGKVKQADFLLFNQQLAALLKAGIPVLQAIGLLKTRSASANLRAVLADVEEKIRNGVSLSEAFEAQNIFPKIYTASILAGEKSGALDDVLRRYVEYLRRSVGVSRKIRGAMAYPAFLMSVAVLMIAFLTLYIVPRMSDLFRSLSANRTLPTITVAVLWVSNTITANFFWLFPLLLILGLAGFIWIRTDSGKLAIDRLLLRIPIAGQLIRQMATAQLSRSLSTLISGGITVPDSWEIAAQALNNSELRRRSQAVLPMIREGRGFTESIRQAGWMPELALDMIGIGERSGSLREMLDEVAAFYDAEAEVKLEQFTTLLEPVILIVMAIIVLIILLAIYLPIIETISAGPAAGRR
jgi:type IV pilus assembly protein PilC